VANKIFRMMTRPSKTDVTCVNSIVYPHSIFIPLRIPCKFFISKDLLIRNENREFTKMDLFL